MTWQNSPLYGDRVHYFDSDGIGKLVIAMKISSSISSIWKTSCKEVENLLDFTLYEYN